MITVTDLKHGVTFQDEGQIYRVLSYEHIKMGRGSANIKVKAKNLRSGAVIERSFINGAKVNEATLTKKRYQYLYKDEVDAFFMDESTYEQMQIALKALGDDSLYLKEGGSATLVFFDDEPLGLELAPKMEFTIVDTGPNVKGNSASNVYKDAILDNGMKVRVPLFMEIGNRVSVDTRTGQYSERISK